VTDKKLTKKELKKRVKEEYYLSKIEVPKYQTRNSIYVDLRISKEENIEKINKLYDSGVLCFDSPEVLRAIRDKNDDQDKLDGLLYDDIIKVYCPNININGYRLIQYLIRNNLSLSANHSKLITIVEEIIKSKPKSKYRL